jgi:hypothetical protein
LFPLYSDEDTMARVRLAAGRRLGFDWLGPGDLRTHGQTDSQQLETATDLGRVIVTSNAKDFHRLHTEWMVAGRSHAGIIVVRQSIPIGLLLRKLSQMQEERSVEQMRDAILFISNAAVEE